MLKVVLPLLFAAFALTTALPVRNRFFEDVGDYKRDFVPKKTSDFYEIAYDEYLRRREPALSEGMFKAWLDFVFATLYFIVYMYALFTFCLQVFQKTMRTMPQNGALTTTITETSRVCSTCSYNFFPRSQVLLNRCADSVRLSSDIIFSFARLHGERELFCRVDNTEKGTSKSFFLSISKSGLHLDIRQLAHESFLQKNIKATESETQSTRLYFETNENTKYSSKLHAGTTAAGNLNFLSSFHLFLARFPNDECNSSGKFFLVQTYIETFQTKNILRSALEPKY